MMYKEFEVGNQTYKLRLDTRAIVALEKKLGCNPLAIFGDGDTIPPVSAMIAILHAALQPLEHGYTEDAAMKIFDEYLKSHIMTDFLTVIIDIYRVSGLIAQETELKNA